jgi:peptidyl-prolyl cis-trans isomerase SurA
MGKKVNSIYIILALISGISLCEVEGQQEIVIDKVIARVGTESILISDVENQYSYQAERFPGESDELKCEILQSLVAQKLIVHQAKLDSIEVPVDQLEANLDFRIQNVLRQMNGDESFFEEYYGMTINEMRDNLRSDLEQQMLAEQMQNKVISEVNITPKEVKEFFSNIPVDSIPFLNAEVELSEIVIAPEINEEERSKALQQIVDIRKRIIEGGESFEELAVVYSDDPGSGSRGGDLGFAERGIYVQEFEAAAFSLDDGEISDPVESVHGFHIIKMIERRGNKIHVKHILVKPNITQVDLDRAKAKLDTIKMEVEEGKMSFEEAVTLYSNDEVPSYHNNGRMQNPNSGKYSFETAELPSDIYFAIEDIEVGEITDPIEYPLPTGETYFRLIKLESKTRPHRASLEKDYTKILNFAKESKKNEYFSQWLEDKLKETFVELDRKYLVCPDLEELLVESKLND